MKSTPVSVRTATLKVTVRWREGCDIHQRDYRGMTFKLRRRMAWVNATPGAEALEVIGPGPYVAVRGSFYQRDGGSPLGARLVK